MIQLINRKIRNRKGFTLIELIVVIAILGILAAIAIPRFAGFTDKGKDAADKQYGSLVGNSLVVLMAEGSLTGPVDITLAGATGAYSATSGTLPAGEIAIAAAPLGTATALDATDDARLLALVAKKPLAKTTRTVRVHVSATGVVTVYVRP